MFQIVYGSVLLLLICLRIVFNNVSTYVNLANYISMVLAAFFVIKESIPKIQGKRQKNICKALCVLFIIVCALIGAFVFICGINIPVVVNDVITLIALMLSLCNKVFEFIIIKIATL